MKAIRYNLIETRKIKGIHMQDQEKKGIDWIALIFIFIVLPIAFTVGGTWVGIAILAIGVVAFGWKKRHEGPFPTNKSDKDS
jgi:hypothetical protein